MRRGGDGVGWDIEDWQASNGVGSFWGLFGVCKCASVQLCKMRDVR